MTNEIKEPIGSLRISKDVLATIATNATKEIEGVAGIAPLTTNIRNWITKTFHVGIALKSTLSAFVTAGVSF